MKLGNESVIWIGALVLFATPVLGNQPQPPSSSNSGGFDVLIDNPSVQKELKLSDDQADRVRELRRQIKEKAFAKIREQTSSPVKDKNATDPQAKTKELMKAASDETLKGLVEILKAEQLKRLKQIRLQQEGLNALFDPDVMKALALTDDQKGKLQGIQEDLKKESSALFKAGPQSNFQASLKKVTTLRREALDKGLTLLTADQMKTWIDLAGDPFEMKAEPFILRRPGIGK